MRRIDSVGVPSETRRMLRERLSRFLPAFAISQGYVERPVRPAVSDTEVVELFLNLVLIPGNDTSHVRSLYEQASQAQTTHHTRSSTEACTAQGVTRAVPVTDKLHESPVSNAEDVLNLVLSGAPIGGETRNVTADSAEGQDSDSVQARLTVSAQVIATFPCLEGLSPPPSFDELVEHGWIRESWGRILVPSDIVMTVLRNPLATGAAFKLLVEGRCRDSFRLASGFNPSDELNSVANDVIEERCRPGEIVCISRPWIAARLWDTNFEGSIQGSPQDPGQRIGQWIDKWRLLNWPSFALSDQLSTDSFEEFIEAAIDVLRAPSTLPDWTAFQAAARAPTALLYPHRAANLESIVPEIPESTVERIRWMADRTTEQTFNDYLESRGSSVLTVLLNELQNATMDSKQLASRVMALAIERPVLLQQLVLKVRQAPTLLADMLMVPSTCALACSLIASWEFNDGGWNREFQAQANHTTELFAFEDALALLGGHLDAGQLTVSELKALYLYIYELTLLPRKSSQRYDMLELLRHELAAAVSNIQDAVVGAIVASAVTSTNPMTYFCAALDLASEGGCIDRIAPSDVVSLYLDVLLPRGERVRLRQLEFKIAQSFVALVQKCDSDLRSRALNAVNVHTWLQSAAAGLDEQYQVRDLVIRRIRLHVRVLSRAIAAWPSVVPAELVDALSNAIHAGATENLDRGRIDAFAAGSGFGLEFSSQDAPIAVDLAAALRRLQGSTLQTLILQLCQLEEPVVLAGILANTPAALNSQIRARLLTLTPETSSHVSNLPALQARVEALMNADLPDRAEVFLAEERDALTLGPVPGREITTLRVTLRLLLMREDWTAISSYTMPDNIPVAQRQDANDAILFYRGIAELQKSDGNPAAAEAIFLGLTGRHRGVTSYRTNLFASQVHRVLGGNALGLLSGEPLSQAKRYLADAERNTRPLVQHSPSDLKSLDSNRAMLLLAAGQPRESLQILLDLRESIYDERVEGFRALALARLGSRRESLALLTQIENIFGRSDFLSATRENIDGHRPYASAPSLALDDDPVPGLRHAFAAFARLSHVEQAEVLQSRGQFDLYLLEEVRGACASLVALAPMMRELGMVRYEDDISGVLKQVLRSRLLLPQWAVEDQSLGGYARSGGPGRRD